jgi:hypothetical protein
MGSTEILPMEAIQKAKQGNDRTSQREFILACVTVAMLLFSGLPSRIFAGVIVTVCLLLLLSLVRGAALDSLSSILPWGGCIFFYLIGILSEGGKLYVYNRLDIVGMVLAGLSIMLYGQIPLGSARRIIDVIIKSMTVFSLVLSILGLLKFLMLINGEFVPVLLNISLEDGVGYPQGTALISDYNMHALALCTGVLAAFFVIIDNRFALSMRWLSVTSIIISSTAILFAGSRRGWITLGLYIVLGLAFLVSRPGLLSNKNRSVPDSPDASPMKAMLGILAACIVALAIGFSSVVQDVAQDSVAVTGIIARFQSIEQEVSATESRLGGRESYWNLALDLIGEYSLIQFMLGNGFSYLEIYGREFSGGASGLNYPHSPLLASFLYSGLLGAFWVASLIVLVAWKALLLTKPLGNFLLILYLTHLSFILISGNSIFSFLWFPTITTFILEIENRHYQLAMPF